MSHTFMHAGRSAAERDRAFWRAALLASESTALPRWTLAPEPGIGEHTLALPDALAAALRRLTDPLGVPLAAALLAAHAKVLGALAGEQQVTAGFAVAGAAVLPLRLTLAPHSWRELLRETALAEADLLAHGDFAVDALQRELGLDAPLFESVFDADLGGGGGDGDGAALPQGAVLRIGFVPGEKPVLRLHYRKDAFDADSAARIAGYHLRALNLLAADPDAEHAQQCLLSEPELLFQLHDLAGPRRALPDRRAHELFEDRARAHPDAIAAQHGERRLSYRQLNERANQIGRALLAHGLGHEDVVAVVTERNLDWMAAVLAIFKAGGAYLPIEPHFPAERIATLLSRAGCRLVLAERGSTATLDPALASLAGVSKLLIDSAAIEGHGNTDLGIAVEADQLAYIYFTSGSTGEPKGAMCEHEGMLNHLFAKIDDLAIDADSVVAQTARQCFDISLWQLLAALLAGGRTLVVEQEVILDVPRFVDTLVDAEVQIVQLVPSYLELVVSHLEQQPRALPRLRYVSVTGEALKKALAQRWFALQPGIRLVNAYGLTETSDDTNHEILDRAPQRDGVPLGRPVNNVHVDIVDENLLLVPLGARGEIVFSGVCVGRGYVNDPERTRRAFMADPHRYGYWMYRSGDFGRWLPDGKLEFLGRRDGQVKINGFRIEIGEVENALLRVPGVRDGAVVVSGAAEQGRRLVAFYSGEQPLDAQRLHERLAERLPGYMVPASFHWRASLPLSENGKIDRKALGAALAAQDDAAGAAQPDWPRTATEERLAGAWAQVLGIAKEQIGLRDHFFELGGTSLSALRLAIKLKPLVSMPDLAQHPVLADLAALIDARLVQRSRAGQPAAPMNHPH